MPTKPVINKIKVKKSKGFSGEVDTQSLLQVINSHRSEVNDCYEIALRKKERLSGEQALKWVINSKGFVVSTRIQKIVWVIRKCYSVFERKCVIEAFLS